jgi:ADP-L-glycero-D-manno-heptose 6-epimerase
MKLLVTGSDGFIGKNLCHYIENEMDIIPYTLDPYDFYKYHDWTGILNKNLDDINPDVIFHVGACSDTLETDVNYMMELNYETTKILVDWASRNNKKIIYSSSAASYGINKKYPSNLYGWSKYVAEGYVISNGGIGLRYFNVYGPGESHKGRMSSVALQMFTRSKISEKILLFPGEPKRDFVYIKDVISANIFSMYNYEELKSDWYDVGSFQARSFEDVLRNIGIKEWSYHDISKIPQGYQFFTEASKIIPGWGPKYTLERGLEEYIKVLNRE